MDQDNGIHDFDFWAGEWYTLNRRRTNAMYQEKEGEWQTFASFSTAQIYLDGRANVDTFEAILPNGEHRKGMSLRSFNPETRLWSILWLDSSNPPDLSPVVGKFRDGIGLFYEETQTFDGHPVKVRFTWDNITPLTARWSQAFSFNGGQTWDTNWIADHTRCR